MNKHNRLDKDLVAFLRGRNSRFKNEKGMEMGINEGDELWTYFCLCNHDRGPLAMSITTEEDNIGDFINLFRLNSLKDIHELEYKHSWIRYLNGHAEIEATQYELEATLTFRILGRKTLVYSLELHYYDEVYEHLTLAEDFEKYIATHKSRLSLAAENRYKMSRK